MKQPCVYILASSPNGTLYIGVTGNLRQRIHQHRAGDIKGFTQRYDVKHLVYIETHDRMEDAITREKRLKTWQRDWKIRLIEEHNPQWLDLFEHLNS
ncbi:GIY-YIG nuclease family protein [Thalassospira alkalitolerans]|uniref:GIY-YIG nuclease family protein n=1 Tax=Thalassospira alkalitolerans TaxID=1293890 RepID=UPI0030EF42A5|tara:strand:- start:20786 stop:21076 length:291 start_codon:yes stop_codon:yes gene_type:complete